jgi:hypothetical protein
MKNSAIKYGILGGVGVIAYFLVFYFIQPQLMLEPAVQWSSLVIYFTFMFLAAKQTRDTKGDETFTFREALRPAFLAFIIMTIIYYAFNFILYKVDPTMIIYEKEMAIRNMRWLAEWTGQDLPEQELQKFRAENRPVTIGNSVLWMLRSFIGGFILSLPVAAVVRR